MAARCQQGLVAALFHDAPGVQHDDVVGVPQGGHPVADQEHRAPLLHLTQTLQDTALGFGVHGAHAVVEDQDARLAGHRPRQGRALALAAAEGHAAFAQHGVVALRKGHDLAREARDLGGPLHPLHVGLHVSGLRRRGVAHRLERLDRAVVVVVQPEGHVAGNRVGKQKRLLRHHRDVVPQGGERDVPHVMAVHLHAALAHVAQAGHELGEQGLAAARRAGDAQRLPGWDVQRDAAQHLLAVETQADVLVTDVALQGLDAGVGAPAVVDPRARREDFLQPSPRSHAALEHVGDQPDAQHGPGQPLQDQGELGELPEGQRAAGHQPQDHAPAVQQHQHVGNAHQQAHEGLQRSLDPVQEQCASYQLGVHDLVLRDLTVLDGVPFHDPGPGKVLLRLGRDRAVLLLHRHVAHRHLPRQVRQNTDDERKHHQHRERQPPVDGKKPGERHQKAAGHCGELPAAEADHLTHGAQVAGQAVHQVAGAGAVKVVLVQTAQVGEQVAPDLVLGLTTGEHDAAAHPDHQAARHQRGEHDAQRQQAQFLQTQAGSGRVGI